MPHRLFNILIKIKLNIYELLWFIYNELFLIIEDFEENRILDIILVISPYTIFSVV